MLHKDCKTPQLPDNELTKYLLKVQDQTIPADLVRVIDAKEERKKRKQKVPEAAAVSPSDSPKSNKRAKKSEKSVDRVVNKQLKVM